MGIVYCAITTANIAIGYGQHAYVLEPSVVEEATFLNSLSFLFGIVSFSIPKLAVAAMLTRIMNPNFWNRLAIWGLTGLGAVISGICIIVLFTMCDPPRALWKTHLVKEGKASCRDTWILINYAIFTGGLSLFQWMLDCANFSLLCFYRSLSRHIPRDCSLEAANVATETHRFIRRLRARSNVRLSYIQFKLMIVPLQWPS